MERKEFDIVEIARDFVISKEEEYLNNLYSEHNYYMQIPSQNFTAEDQKRLQILDILITKEEIRLGYQEPPITS